MSETIREKCQRLGLTWVGASGPTTAKIMIVGEAPGAEEERQHEPFVGGAGHLLDGVLRQVGILRKDLYITNVVKVKPPRNDLALIETLGVTKSEFLPFLTEEIKLVKPNVVVALGGHALAALTSLPQVMKYRGSILESTLVLGVKVIASVHPAAVLRNYKWRPLLLMDMKRVIAESSSPLIEIPQRILKFAPTFDYTESFLKQITESNDIKLIACDIETDKLGMLSCIGLSPHPNFAFCIPFRNGYASYWSEGEEYVIWKLLKRLFIEGEKNWIFQNALFDLRWIVPRVGYFDVWMDTMWAHQTIYAEIPKGLDTLASIYTKEPYYKDERKVWKDTSITQQLWSYNCKDAAVTHEVALKLIEELKEHKLTNFFFGYVMKLMPILLKLEMRGMRLNTDTRDQLRKEYEEKMKELEASFGGVNIRSSKQMQKLLYEEMGFTKQFHPKKGTVTTGKDALIKLRGKLR